MMTKYIKINRIKEFPRIPMEGYIDLTYRCNFNCLHCWLRIPERSPEREKELTLDEIKKIVTEARNMGCQRWLISGGEPMLRSDFPEIFDYISSRSTLYSLNTNGSLITPDIARLMKRKGNKWVALYGATADVYDHITRTPGSFDAAMKGFSLLKEAGTGFVVQIIPMRDNYHQYHDMIKLAESLSPHWRIGAEWFYLSASGDPVKNEEIKSQRLDPRIIVDLNKPDLSFNEIIKTEDKYCSNLPFGQNKLFAACIDYKRDFHIDPYGRMTFCNMIKDPLLRYDLSKGNFRDCWENFIPSLSNKIRDDEEYLQNCGSCESKNDCGLCPVYAYLEKRRFSAKVDYFCKIEEERKKHKDNWEKNHRRYFEIAGLTMQVNSDLPITDNTFLPRFKHFEVSKPGNDIIITHHFSLPELKEQDLGVEVYRKPPWAIYKKGNSWIYLGIAPTKEDKTIYQVIVFNHDHTHARIYNNGEEFFSKGNLSALTLFPSDQILLARVIADNDACFLHSSGVVFENNGLLFVGHSEAGKSTIVKMLKNKAEILCDDRNIIRRLSEEYRIYGTWSHGEVPLVSSASAPLKGIFFLNKGQENRLSPVKNRQEAIKKILGCLIKPFLTTDWWNKIFIFVERLVREIPCYNLYFDKSGQVVNLLRNFNSVETGLKISTYKKVDKIK